MKEHNAMDTMFQTHFENTSVPMPNQEVLWDRITQKKNKDRGGIWYWGGLGLALLLTTGFLYSNNKTNSDSSSTSTAPIVEKYITNDYSISKPENTNPVTNTKTNSASASRTTNTEIIKSAAIQPTPTPKPTGAFTALEAKVQPTLNNDQSISQATTINPSKETSSESIAVSEVITKNNTTNVLAALVMSPSLLHTSEQLEIFGKDKWDNCEIKESSRFFVDAYGQGGLPIENISLTQNASDQTAYQALWEDRFSPKASWHGGIQVGYELPIGLRISAGAEYQEVISEYADVQRITETTVVWNPQAFFTTDANGDRVWVGDSVVAINIFDQRFVRKNKFTLLHIPIQLGFDIYKSSNFHIELNASAALNISKTYTGQYLRPSDQLLIQVDDSNMDNYFSTDIGVSLDAGLHFGYYLNDQWEAYAASRFRINPNSYLLEDQPLNISKHFAGIRVGVRRYF